MKSWIREPLIHFLLIGVCLFGVYYFVNTESMAVNAERIVVSGAEIERIKSNWQKQWNRSPTQSAFAPD